MTLFQPTRASPPLRSIRTTKTPPAPPSIDTLSIISSSTVVVTELRNLTYDDIDFIEAVVKRAGPLATTFPIVFKAYNDVLRERGMDSGEVRYYGKLLKLGTMKGKNWGEKWEAVKRQHNETPAHSDDDQETVSSRVKPRSKVVSQISQTAPPRLQDIDADTILSDPDDDGFVDVPQYHQISNLFSGKRQTSSKSSTTQKNEPKLSMVSSLRGLPSSMLRRSPPSDAFILGAETVAPSAIPTSHGVLSKEQRHYHREVRSRPPPVTKVSEVPQVTGNNRFSGARLRVVQARGRHTADEDDAWNQIRIQQLEAEAERFREERLLERCWQVWAESYRWIVTSHLQIDQARRAFLLRLAFHHWRSGFASRKTKYEGAVVLDDERRLWSFLGLWRKRAKEKQQARWRNDMRNKMKMIRDRQNLRILRDVWILWRQKYQLHFADQQYRQKILLLAFLKWKDTFYQLESIEGKAEQLITWRDQRLLLQTWEIWRATTGIASAEKEVVDRVHARIIWNAWRSWKKHTYDYRRATFFRGRSLQKGTLVKWRNSLRGVHALAARADKHTAQQDKILTCAVVRVWLAHVRGREVDRRRDKKHLYWSWLTWKEHIVQNVKRDACSQLLSSDQHTRRISKLFTMADNAPITSEFWTTWLSRFREGVEERKRQKLVKKLQDRQAARVLYRWLLLTRQRRRCAQTEVLVQERFHQRLGRSALAHWTERVIFMRERELHALEIYNAKLERDAWTRFKSAHTRHQENLKLLDDHLTLKYEDTLSRLFHRWLANTRVTQHRRFILQSKESEMKSTILQRTWDKWKSSYLERRLRPLEIEMLMRSQQNLMYQAFSVWHAKARTRPAIVAVKFNAEHTKKKFYLKWREALPIAQKARRVREKHDNLIQSRVFKQWLEAYRTKLVMKAVARARYLRLPTSGARTVMGQTSITRLPSSSVSPPPTPHESAPIFSKPPYPIRSGVSYRSRRRNTKVSSMEEATTCDKEALDDDVPASTGARPRTSRLSRSPFGLGQGTGIVSLLRTNVHQGTIDLSPPRSKYQPSNPKKRRGLSANGSESRGGLFTSVNAESTPPFRGTRSTASDDVAMRRTPWNQLKIGRRPRDPSPSVTSHLTESPPTSP